MSKFDNIPLEMREYPNWVLADKHKIPHNVRGGFAKVNAPSTWGAYDQTVAKYNKGGYAGIGFVFGNSPFAGVDIDNCYDPETQAFTDEAVDIITTLDSYSEFSQSGRGVHVIVKGRIPGRWRRRGNVEMYDSGSARYFIMTGDFI